MRRSEEGFRHGMRVRVGSAKGLLLKCERRTGEGHYWKIRLQGGEWIWPDDFAVDGSGDEFHASCGQCRLPFYTSAGSGELICRRCDAEMFGTAIRRFEPDPPRQFEDYPAHRRRRR